MHSTAPISTKGCHYLNVSPANLESVSSTFLPNKFTEGTRQIFPFFACSWSCCDKSLKCILRWFPTVWPHTYNSDHMPGVMNREGKRQATVQCEVQLTLPSPNHPISTASWWSAGAWIIQLQLARLAKPKPQWDCCRVRTGARNWLTYMVCFSGVM